MEKKGEEEGREDTENIQVNKIGNYLMKEKAYLRNYGRSTASASIKLEKGED